MFVISSNPMNGVFETLRPRPSPRRRRRFAGGPSRVWRTKIRKVERRSKRGLAIKSRFRHSEGNDCFFLGGGVIPNGKPANKGFRREDRPDPYSERVEERRCLSDALRDEASEHTPTAGLRGRRLRPARGQAPQRFPERRRFSTRSGCAEEKRIDSRTSPHPALDGSAHPPLRRTGSCGGGDVPVLVSYGSREPYGKGSGIAEPKTFT